jgi:DNA invertase Pin-like site-specific DNA recombinase
MSTAIYERVSSKQQDTKAQATALDAYKAQLKKKGEEVVEYSDRFTGKTKRRPGWHRLWADVAAGKVNRIVVWRLDRLGRTVSGLSQLFEQMIACGVTLVSLKDCLDLLTAAGRQMANVLASVAAYETEVRSGRQLAGIAAKQRAIAKGEVERYGTGRKTGDAWKLNAEKTQAVHDLKAAGKSVSEIARVTGLSRPTVYKALAQSVA